MSRVYLLSVTNSLSAKLDIKALAKEALWAKVIRNYVLIGENAFAFHSDYGTYFLSQRLGKIFGSFEFIFTPLSFGDFGGSLSQAIWDDFERTFEGAMDELLEADAAALDRLRVDEQKYSRVK